MEPTMIWTGDTVRYNGKAGEYDPLFNGALYVVARVYRYNDGSANVELEGFGGLFNAQQFTIVDIDAANAPQEAEIMDAAPSAQDTDAISEDDADLYDAALDFWQDVYCMVINHGGYNPTACHEADNAALGFISFVRQLETNRP